MNNESQTLTVAPFSVAAPTRGQRVWRWLVPQPTPAHARPELRTTPAWAAYGLLLVIFALVFGESIARFVFTALEQGGAPVKEAPRAHNFFSFDYAGYRWSIEVVTLVIAGASVWALARYHRISWRLVFAPRPTPEVHRKRQTRRVFVWALASTLLSLGLMGVIESLTPSNAAGGFAMPTPADVLWMNAYQGPTVVTAGLREEIVVVGLLVVLLMAARRPTWEIVTVAVVIKLSYHLYYGAPALGLIPFALTFAWLYHRTGRLWPLILAHAIYNAGFIAVQVIPALMATH